ncbi:hypothetical protein H5410_019652 [Solanum commersonii]|uniref:Uncharacterized protein n=1 Tax=Solanum commersonii TaxID=4109 RepID=A0A9J5Z5U6_SOLCO|nr:hypothetical protein H5410_019652 [Solanum commersonii]
MKPTPPPNQTQYLFWKFCVEINYKQILKPELSTLPKRKLPEFPNSEFPPFSKSELPMLLKLKIFVIPKAELPTLCGA